MSSLNPSLLSEVRAAIRLRHYSIRTEEAYVNVIRHFILYHQKRHPKEMRPKRGISGNSLNR
jgi:hypothetical protein